MSGGGDEIVKKVEGAEVLYFPGAKRPASAADVSSGGRSHNGDAEGGAARAETPKAADLPSEHEDDDRDHDGARDGAADRARAQTPDPRAAAGAGVGQEKPSQMGGSAEIAPAAERGADGGAQAAPDPSGGLTGPRADDPLDRRCAFLPLTDLGNAERFVERFGRRFKFCEAIGWLAWDGRRWNRDQAEGLVKLAEHECVRAIQDEAEEIRDTPLDFVVEWTGPKDDRRPVWFSQKVAAWGRASESANRLVSISRRAAPMLQIATDALDRDPMKLNVLNGTLVFSKDIPDGYVRLDPHDPDDLITKLAPVLYNPEADCPKYRAFMADVHPPIASDGPKTAIRALHQWAGLSMTGETGEQRYTFHYGKGRNGKGVWVSTVSHLLGDYAASIRIESFLDSGRAQAGGQATPDLAKLPGVRFLTTSEPKKGATLDEGLVKLFTGEDSISARFLNKEFFEFKPEAKLTMQGNYRPKISGTDEGIWNRTILAPWPVFIPPERRNPRLAHELRAEASGILNAFLDGLRDWLDHGLVLPPSWVGATEDYRSDSDPLGRFLEACTSPEIGKRVQSSEMHALFVAWAKANGETEWTSKGLAMALKERGLAAKKSDNVFWLDITLTKTPGDFVDAQGKPLRAGQAPAGGPSGENWEPAYDD